jgi:hypothetical protein
MKAKHGWMVQVKKNCYLGAKGHFFSSRGFDYAVEDITKATAYSTRKFARELANNLEKVVKVSLDDEGKPVAIIGRG